MPDDVDVDVDILILGAGWTADFLIPYLEEQQLTYAATRRSLAPRDKLRLATIPGCIKFDIDADTGRSDSNSNSNSQNDDEQYTALPSAKMVLITFPLQPGQPAQLVEAYRRTHPRTVAETTWLQLGSTGIYSSPGLSSCESDYDATGRSIAEDELRNEYGGTILCLAGLWGGSRQPRSWVGRVAGTKEKLAQKGSLHLVHGEDVARAVVACFRAFRGGRRWIVTDGRVYDWWELVEGWSHEMEHEGTEPEYKLWLRELRDTGENGEIGLPRPLDQLGRWLDSSHFWREMKIQPLWPLTDRYEAFPRL